jgi:hypothetical protein
MRAVLASLVVLFSSGSTLAQSQIQPIYSNDPAGCEALASGSDTDSPDYALFNPASGISTLDFHCDFLQVLPHPSLGWHVATAFCEEPGFQYPDLILFAEQPDRSMSVISQSGVLQKQIDAKAEPLADGSYALCEATVE